MNYMYASSQELLVLHVLCRMTTITKEIFNKFFAEWTANG